MLKSLMAFIVLRTQWFRYCSGGTFRQWQTAELFGRKGFEAKDVFFFFESFEDIKLRAVKRTQNCQISLKSFNLYIKGVLKLTQEVIPKENVGLQLKVMNFFFIDLHNIYVYAV